MNESVQQRTYRHSNGNVFLEGTVKDNLRTGKWKKYFENGALDSELHYSNGVLDGLSREYYEDGTLMEEGTYLNGAYAIQNYWNPEGVQTVKDGNGLVVKDLGEIEDELIISMYRDGLMVSEGTGPKSILASFVHEAEGDKTNEQLTP